MKRAISILGLVLLSGVLLACDRSLDQMVILHVNRHGPNGGQFWISEGSDCHSRKSLPLATDGGVSIFHRATIRGGVSVMTEQLSVCAGVASAGGTLKLGTWIQGGGEEILMISCADGQIWRCSKFSRLNTGEGYWVPLFPESVEN